MCCSLLCLHGYALRDSWGSRSIFAQVILSAAQLTGNPAGPLVLAQVILRQFQPARALEQMQRRRVTVTAIGGLMGAALAWFPGTAAFDLSNLRLLSHGGSCQSRVVIDRLLALAPNCRYFTDYGYRPTLVILSEGIHSAPPPGQVGCYGLTLSGHGLDP
eukprot:1179600-Prorocentrum_minimum.AAC.2